MSRRGARKFSLRLTAERASLAAVALLALHLSAGPALGQNRDGLLGGIRGALRGRSSADSWESAQRLLNAEAALPLMEALAGEEGRGPYAAKAAVWLGHFYYGAGGVREALAYFEQADQPEALAETRSEALFWGQQCRNLLEVAEPEGSRPGLETEEAGVADLFMAMARADGLLRRGQPAEALRAYLSLQGQALNVGCLAPLYYRVALVVTTASGDRWVEGVDWTTVRAWEPMVAASPERALVAAFAPKEKAPAPTGEGEGTPAESLFVESTAAQAPSDSAVGTEAVDGVGVIRYAVQLGAFRERDRARAEMERLVERGLSVRLEREEESDGGTLFRIRLGRVASREEAEDLARRLCRGLEYEIVTTTP